MQEYKPIVVLCDLRYPKKIYKSIFFVAIQAFRAVLGNNFSIKIDI